MYPHGGEKPYLSGAKARSRGYHSLPPREVHPGRVDVLAWPWQPAQLHHAFLLVGILHHDNRICTVGQGPASHDVNSARVVYLRLGKATRGHLFDHPPPWVGNSGPDRVAVHG